MKGKRLVLSTVIICFIGLLLFTLQHTAAETAPPTNTNISLPVGQIVYKIALQADGIYELTYSDLQAANVPVESLNPNTLQMMAHGKPVAYEFVGDADNTFESAESIRFYGWAYDESRHDRNFVSHNVFWLWDNGTPDIIETVNSERDAPVAKDWQASITFEEDDIFNPTYSSNWYLFDNPADAWYWKHLDSLQTYSYTFDTPGRIHASVPATLTVEVINSYRCLTSNRHRLHLTVQNLPPKEVVWDGLRNVNGVLTIPQNQLHDGANQFSAYLQNTSAIGSTGSDRADCILLNRYTIDYLRDFVTSNDELRFSYTASDSVGFALDGFSAPIVGDITVLDITDRYQPVEVLIDSADYSAGQLRFGRTLSGISDILATQQTHAPLSIEPYTVSDIEPDGGAEWVAISHANFISGTQTLAAHRNSFDNMSTHVVDFADIVNQHGFGLPLPAAIQAYMGNAWNNWDTRPNYLLLVGDATNNPRQLRCDVGPHTCPTTWNDTEVTWVPADLLHVDRFLGIIPTDFVYSLIEGDDLIPEIAVGRLPVNTSQELSNVVEKIIVYDQSIRNGAAWTQNHLFIADDADDGGDFCRENQLIRDNHLPDTLADKQYCLDDYLDGTISLPTGTDGKTQMRTDVFNELAINSAGLVNYRGHGGIVDWAASFIDTGDSLLWQNANRPSVIISADCLDSHHGWLGRTSLAETFLLLGDRKGTAAHWGSVGLGFLTEHSALHTAFYDSLHEQQSARIGNAIKETKTRYEQLSLGHDSELYSFVLLGDPAMHLLSPGLAADANPTAQIAIPNQTIQYTLNITNSGNVRDTFTLSATHTNSWPTTVSATSLILNGGESSSVTVTHSVPADAARHDTQQSTIQIAAALVPTARHLTFDLQTTLDFEQLWFPLIGNAANETQPTLEHK